jgi:hypothetical protein
MSPIIIFFIAIRFSGRYDSDYGITFPKTVADDENSQLKTHSKQDETVFVIGMVRIKKFSLALAAEPGADR